MSGIHFSDDDVKVERLKDKLEGEWKAVSDAMEKYMHGEATHPAMTKSYSAIPDYVSFVTLNYDSKTNATIKSEGIFYEEMNDREASKGLKYHGQMWRSKIDNYMVWTLHMNASERRDHDGKYIVIYTPTDESPIRLRDHAIHTTVHAFNKMLGELNGSGKVRWIYRIEMRITKVPLKNERNPWPSCAICNKPIHPTRQGHETTQPEWGGDDDST